MSGVSRGGRVGLAVLVLGLAACGPVLPSGSPTPVPPREFVVVVTDRATGAALSGAVVSAGNQRVATDIDGRATLVALGGSLVAVSADGYDDAEGSVPDSGDLAITLRDNVARGTITDPAGRPLAGVRVFVEGLSVVAHSDEQGRYRLPGVPPAGTLIYKRPGYRLGAIPIEPSMARDVILPQFEARALYAPSAVFEGAGRLDEMLALLDRTEANALVIDVKETSGNLYWATDLPEAVAIGAVMDQPLFDLETLLPDLKARGIYTIARVVVMKDNTMGRAHPQLAVMNAVTGEPWRDYGGGIWLDPFNAGVADYIAALAGDLAAKGFDEVQLDYVRFFSDGDYSTADTNLPNTQSFRLPALRRLFRIVSERLTATRAFLGADVFPISFIATDDQGIGQRPEVVMPFVDYFCPMVYPSHYGPGVFGFGVPNEYPYEVIDRTLEIMNEQKAGLVTVIRPWIQDFGYGPFRAYTEADVLAEMAAARDNGAQGWMIWNARARFTTSALSGPIEGEDSAPVTSASSPSASPTP